MKTSEDLLSIDQVRELLAQTEPLAEVPFSTAEGSAVFSLPSGWNDGLKEKHGLELTDATVSIAGTEYQLTKDAALEITTLIQLTKDYVSKTPGPLVQTHLNYWMSHGDKELKMLKAEGSKTGLAFSKASIEPFSNLQLLDTVLEAVSEVLGDSGSDIGANDFKDSVKVDYKYHHDFRRTVLRLILGSETYTIEHKDGTEDTWSIGVDLKNSLIGEKPLNVSGYLFRWGNTQGMTSAHATSGNYNRKHLGQGEKAFNWVRESVVEILGDVGHELDSLQELAGMQLDGEVKDVLASVFERFKVPVNLRENIIDSMVDAEDYSAYGLFNAVAQSANDPGIVDPARLETARSEVLRIAGALPAALGSRCKKCNSLPSR